MANIASEPRNGYANFAAQRAAWQELMARAEKGELTAAEVVELYGDNVVLLHAPLNGGDGQPSVNTLRHALAGAGYSPIPVNGKKPPLKKWQKLIDVAPEIIDSWDTNPKSSHAHNTGLLTERTPGIDIDILDAAAAIAVEEMVRERFKERGSILVRIGLPPKRLIPFRTAAAFKKIRVPLIAADGDTNQKIEFLGKGQQFVAFGIHPDTHKPYCWSNAGEPGSIKLNALPEISAAEAKQLVEDAAELLVKDFGYRLVGDDQEEKPSSFKKFADSGKTQHLDWSKPVNSILAGVDLHDNIRDLAASMVTSSVSAFAAKGLLKALMQSSSARRDERWQDRFDDIDRAVDSAKKQFVQTTEAEQQSPIEPVPLWAKPQAPLLPRGVLPPIIEEFAFTQGELMGADPSGLAMAALTVCATVIPDAIVLQVKKHDGSWRESTRMWTGLVGGPGEMKSPIMQAVVKPLVRINGGLWRKHLQAKKEYDELPPEERKLKSAPQLTQVLVSDPTVEALEPILLATLPNGTLCYRDELSGFFGSMDRYAGHHASNATRSFWLEAYSGAYHSWNRVGRGSGVIEHTSISVLGGIQPEPLVKLVHDSADDGLIQRINMIMLRPATKGKDEPSRPAIENYETLVERLHGLNVTADYHFTDEAHEIRRELEHKHLKLVQQYQTINKKLASHIGKFNGMFARMCLIWHVIAQIDNKQHWPRPSIGADIARQVAKFLHEFLLPHAVSFYVGELGLSDIHNRLIAVVDYILAHKLEQITARDVQRGDRAMRNLDRRDIEKVFNHLEACGWVIDWVDQGRGRPSGLPVGIVNPLVHQRYGERGEQERQRREELREMILQACAE